MFKDDRKENHVRLTGKCFGISDCTYAKEYKDPDLLLSTSCRFCQTSGICTNEDAIISRIKELLLK